MPQSDIVVFGSINLDLIFAMDALPEPGQTRLARRFSMQPGGKGANQAVAARRAGAVVHMVGAVGEDDLAPLALAGMMESGVDLAHLRRIPGVATGCAGVATDIAGRNQIAVALGANALLSADDLPVILTTPGSVLLVQMEAEPQQVAAVMRRAYVSGMHVVLNLAPAGLLPKEVLAAASLIVVNEDEADFLSAQFGCEATAAALHLVLGVTVIRTLGGEGAEAAGPDGPVRVTPPRIHVVDTTAAGDCFVGTLAAAVSKGLPLHDGIQRACIAASLACTVAGSQQSLPLAAEVNKIAGSTS
ncbi:ribokinase [Acidisphaera sp. L21]|uniref:ribokinase n=1 Tax=Acidisphaera sp. L21 TaxID=1641851 RepID=UPI00131DF37D|nr:ribokinase [Acidisphaera sp. L21]